VCVIWECVLECRTHWEIIFETAREWQNREREREMDMHGEKEKERVREWQNRKREIGRSKIQRDKE